MNAFTGISHGETRPKKPRRSIERQSVITVDFRKLEIFPGDKILDIGCGEGRHACEASKYADVMVIGADIDVDKVSEATHRLMFHEAFGFVRGQWKTCLADLCRLPFSNGVFDLVICSEVLEHIHDHEQAVSEIMRVLKPGKTLVVTVPRYWPERICWMLSESYRTAENGHVRIYGRKELTGLLERAGASVQACHWAHSLHTPYWWLKCMVGPARKNSGPVAAYHRFLVWDMMKKPRVTRLLEKMLDPLLGKSLVLYFRKHAAPNAPGKRTDPGPA